MDNEIELFKKHFNTIEKMVTESNKKGRKDAALDGYHGPPSHILESEKLLGILKLVIMENKLPEGYRNMVEKLENQEDVEYQTYLKLKEKFEK